MKPDVPSVLTELARLLTADVAPALPPGAVAGELGLWAALLNTLAERWDGHVAGLVTQNARLEALVERGATFAPSRERLASLARAKIDGLRVSELEARHGALLEALIEIQVAIEEDAAAAQAALDAEIWRELADAAKRERAAMAQF